MALKIPFDHSYARLPPRFFSHLPPTPVPAPSLVRLNTAVAEGLGLDPAALATVEGVAMLAGNLVPEGAKPLAQAYAGHQFGFFNPQLGDGRAILLGELIDRNGARRDLQLKGSGRTPYSRGGDGRAAIGPVLREYLISEAMAAFAIPTTRSLAAVTTGATVLREMALPGAVLTRIAASHIRVGTFQFAVNLADQSALRALADYVIARHYAEVDQARHRYRALLSEIVGRQADLIAQWLLVGFIHGVMNTDNMAVSGETIDYGPCAFLDSYDPEKVFSSIDHNGRYAYGQQPHIALWNLTRLAETFLPLLAEEATLDDNSAVSVAREILDTFGPRFQAAYGAGLRRKLGLATEQPADISLATDLLRTMATHEADFTLTFRLLCDAASDPESEAKLRALFAEPLAYDTWAMRWHARLAEEHHSPQTAASSMRAVNPAYIPRNHRVEAALSAATLNADFGPFETLLEVIQHPYEERAAYAQFADPPTVEERVTQTFCGT